MLTQLNLKKHIYNSDDYILYNDSLNNDIINLEFESVNLNQYWFLKNALKHNAVITTYKENNLLNRLFNRKKVILSTV